MILRYYFKVKHCTHAYALEEHLFKLHINNKDDSDKKESKKIKYYVSVEAFRDL